LKACADSVLNISSSKIPSSANAGGRWTAAPEPASARPSSTRWSAMAT